MTRVDGIRFLLHSFRYVKFIQSCIAKPRSVIMAGDLYADVLERMKRKASNKLGSLIPV